MNSFIFNHSIQKSLSVGFWLCCCLLCFSFQSQAQCQNPRHNHSHSYRHNHSCCNKLFQTHLRLGGSLHGIGGPSTPRLGTTVGLIHELYVSRRFQLRLESSVLWQGQKKNFWVADGDVDYFSVHVPFMLQIMPSNRFYIASGLGLSYLAHAQGGSLPKNRLGFNWVSVLHYRFCCNRIGLELRWNHHFKNPNTSTYTDVNGKVIAPFDNSSLQFAFTVRF